MSSGFKRHFFTGILFLIPLAVVVWIAKAVLESVWQLHRWVPAAILDSASPLNVFLIKLLATLVLTLATIAAITAIGYFSNYYLGRQLLKTISSLIEQIPILGSIYQALNQLVNTLSKNRTEQFSRVVYLPFPNADTYTVGFVTGVYDEEPFTEKHLSVFVPTVPNPISGFFLVIEEKKCIDLPLPVDKAFQLILSLGIIRPNSPLPPSS